MLLRLYIYLGNTCSRKNTEVYGLGPRLALYFEWLALYFEWLALYFEWLALYFEWFALYFERLALYFEWLALSRGCCIATVAIHILSNLKSGETGPSLKYVHMLRGQKRRQKCGSTCRYSNY